MEAVRRVVLAIVLLVLVAGSASATTYIRVYEASSTHAYGTFESGGGFASGALCFDGRDLWADTGSCVAYVRPGLYDWRGHTFTVEVDDVVFGRSTYIVVVVDVDGDNEEDCTTGVDVCLLGQGTVSGAVPASAAGGMLRVFPVTMYTDAFGCCPVPSSATRGEVAITFHPKPS